ncbi:MAG: FxsA family protein [Deltaproteobacteria bacterium]|nr:FxsA family protein [Deltaproteobacteria bacterium]
MPRWLIYLVFSTITILAMAESVVFLAVGNRFGTNWTMAWVVFTFFLGYFILRVQGIKSLYRIHLKLQADLPPTKEMMDGILVVAGSVGLMVPGYLSDVGGVLLLFPPTRILTRQLIFYVFRNRFSLNRPMGYPAVSYETVVEAHATRQKQKKNTKKKKTQR